MANSKIFSMLSIFIFIASCGPSKIELKTGSMESIQNEQSPIVFIYYDEPKLEVNTAAGVAGMAAGIHAPSILGGLTSFEQRQVDMLISDLFPNDRFSNEDIDFSDGSYLPPAYFVLQIFKAFLTKEKRVETISKVIKLDAYLDLTELREKYGDVIIFDFKTTCCSINYYPLNWNKYWHMLCSQARMIDLHNNEILWQAFGNHNSVSQSAKDAPTYKDLFDNDAVGFKQRIMESAKQNAAILISQFSEK